MVNNAWLVVTNVIIFFESAVSCVFYVKKKADCPWFNAADEYSFTANVSLFLECVYPFRSKLKKGRTYFKIQGTYFKICRTYFCPRKIGLSGHGWKRAFSCEYIFVFRV